MKTLKQEQKWHGNQAILIQIFCFYFIQKKNLYKIYLKNIKKKTSPSTTKSTNTKKGTRNQTASLRFTLKTLKIQFKKNQEVKYDKIPNK